MPRDMSIKKVLMIGSGPIVIGQAAEFDYAGTQACRVLKEAGVEVVLVNSNPATIMTDKSMADAIYLEPLTAQTVMRIIEKEKPDAMLAGLGGQTGLTIAMQLGKSGFLKAHNVRLLGTGLDAIDKAEDRQLFKEAMERIGQPIIPSEIANDVDTAVQIARDIGYPVIVRPAFTLGGAGGGVAYTEEELRTIAFTGLDLSPITQILVERYIAGWKEIEFEVMRDKVGNVIAICSMENFDPVGVHTGDSIVVAPALTLADAEYQMLRTAALDIITEMGIEGGCNCQFALNPDSFEYAVIEVNPRVSRSSALASKATGYPIAKVTAKIALGYTLDEIKNDVTGQTTACFEPTVDYIVAKVPKWPFDKFSSASRKLGTQMKATGEVMAIAPSFEMAIMKAVRGAEIGLDTLNRTPTGGKPLEERLKRVNDLRLFTIFEALKTGWTVDAIHEITKIDEWFISKLKNLADFEQCIENKGALSAEEYRRGKRYGYTDAALKRISGAAEMPHEDAVYKMVDTCAAEFAAATPYFYSAYADYCDSRSFAKSGRPVVMVLGSGPIRIGQGIEFDYSSVHCVKTLKSLGYDVVIVNNNPETVSTDYDTADRLYFEPLCPEDVMNIIKAESPVGVVVAFGGQTAIKLTKFLDDNGVKILGTSAEGIDTAEDRERFDALLEEFNIKRPKGMGVNTLEEAIEAAETLGYPVLLRPSYVIGGQNMMIVHDREAVKQYMTVILSGGIDNPVLVDKYMPGTELEVDVISDGENVLIPGIMEHVERAGVHSGDSIAVYPPYNLTDKMQDTIVDCSTKLALSLGTKGLVNIQYLIYDNELYVIEVNPRASRTVPYISKVTGVPMVDLASKVMLGQNLMDLGYGSGLYKTPPYFTVKVPVFSFEKLTDANSILGPEMKSTGEVLGIGKTTAEALFKGLTAAGIRGIPKHGGVLLSVDDHDYLEILDLAKKFYDLGIRLYATTGTAEMIRTLDIEVTSVPGISESDELFDLMESGKIRCIVYTGALVDSTLGDYMALHRFALRHDIPCLTSLDTANIYTDVIASRFTEHNTELVNINDMRTERQKLMFSKMTSSGNDYIFIDNRDGSVPTPESLCASLCDRHTGVGAHGLILIENSDIADAKMRIFNQNGLEGVLLGNSIRSAAKFLYDNGIVKKEDMTIETKYAVKPVHLYISGGKVTSVTVDMGKAKFRPGDIPMLVTGERVVGYPVGRFSTTCLALDTPHCVIFVDRVDNKDLQTIAEEIEACIEFPEPMNVELVRVINPYTLRIGTWEIDKGEPRACGAGACAAVAAAVESGLCKKDTDITVKLRGGDLVVNYNDDRILLSGDTNLVYVGELEI